MMETFSWLIYELATTSLRFFFAPPATKQDRLAALSDL